MPEKNNPVPRRSGIELKGIVLRVPSNQIKVTFIIILPFNLIHWGFFSLFHKDIEGKCRWIIGGGGWGGAKGMLAPPLKFLGGLPPAPSLFLRLCLIQSIRTVYTYIHIDKGRNSALK